MKKMILVLMAVAMLFAFASVASAATTGNNTVTTWNPPGPTYSYPGAPAAGLRGTAAWTSTDGSPHQGYSSSTNKCEVCHSPHRAGDDSTSFKLLYGTTSGSGASGACLVCHVNGSLAIANVYAATGALGGHDLGAVNAVPDSTWATAAATLGCSDCHTVHGAGAINTGALAGKAFILRQRPTWNGTAAAATLAASDETEFCGACHDRNRRLSTGMINSATHYMGAADAATSTASGVLSSAQSTDCDDCHSEPKSTGSTPPTQSSKWPHQSLSIVGLGVGSSTTTITSQGAMDDHCIKCHGQIGVQY